MSKLSLITAPSHLAGEGRGPGETRLLGEGQDGRETRLVLYLILITTLIRLGFAWALGLGVDESYMVSAGRILQLGYFDHPPASWWMQWSAAHLFGTEAALVVRLPFILVFALSTWLMYRLGTAIAGRQAGLWAAITLNLSPVFGVTTGTWVLPDGPLDCALIAAALCLVHALPARGTLALKWWAAAGACAGLALFSKYTAILTIAGTGIYLVTSRQHRRWLTRPDPYLALFIAGLVFSPVIIWNATHHWTSFAFQSDRAVGLRFQPGQFFVVLAGEALFILPWLWLPMMITAIAALRRGPKDPRSWLLCCLGAPPIVAFALIAIWSSQRVLFHWAAPGYLMLFPLLGAWIADRSEAAWLRRALFGTAALIVAGIAIVATQVRLDWLRPVIAANAKRDPDFEGINWTSLRTQLAERGLLSPGTIVGIPNWRDAGKIAYALGPQVIVTVLNPDARQFGFVHPAEGFAGDTILVLATDDPQRTRRELMPMFGAVEALPPASVVHRAVVLPISVFIGHQLRGS